jgi:hypothetical protein
MGESDVPSSERNRRKGRGKHYIATSRTTGDQRFRCRGRRGKGVGESRKAISTQGSIPVVSDAVTGKLRGNGGLFGPDWHLIGVRTLKFVGRRRDATGLGFGSKPIDTLSRHVL